MVKERVASDKPLNTVQANVKALVDASNLSVAAWARLHELVQTTVNRIVKGKLDPSTENLEQIAKAVGLDAWQLLVPGLDIANPPVLRGMRTNERELYEKIQLDLQRLQELRGE